MTLVYRTNGTWGSGKGSPLTSAEADGNISQLNTRLTTVEGAVPAAARGISSVSASGAVMTITYSDATTSTVTLPTVSYPYRGTWVSSTLYSANDRFTYNGNFYQVLVTHTSGLTFDPFATNGLGQDLYALLMSNPGASFPTGGSTDMVLGKVNGTDFNVSWRQSGVPRAGANAAILCKNSTSDYDTVWLAKTSLTLPFTQITGVATAAQIPPAGTSTIGGVQAITRLSNTFLTQINTSGVPSQAQPGFTDLTGHATNAQMCVPSVGTTNTSTTSIDPTLATLFEVSPGSNITLNAASTPDGGRMYIYFQTSGTISYTMTFGTNFKSTGTLATGTVTDKTFVVHFVCDGVNWYEVSRTTAM